MTGIPTLNILGDSSIIINWAKGTTSLSPPKLHYWVRDTRKLCSCFLELSFSHIYREFNQHADCLSKKALSLALGSGSYSEFIEGHLASHDSFMLFWARCWSMYSIIYCTLFICIGADSFSLQFCTLLFMIDMGLRDSFYWWDSTWLVMHLSPILLRWVVTSFLL